MATVGATGQPPQQPAVAGFPPGVPAAVADACKRVEDACVVHSTSTNAQARAAAEQFLVQVCGTPRPYQLVTVLLARSASPKAVFQALAILRAALWREWALTAPQEIEKIRTALLEYAVKNADKLLSKEWVFCMNQTLYVYTLLYKRAWMADEKACCEAVLGRVRDLLTAKDDATHARKVVGLKLAHKVLTEFDSKQASTADLSWEHHIRCHRSVERHALHQLFSMAVGILEAMTGSLAKGGKWDARIGSECLQVIETTLHWEFAEQVSDAQLILRAMKHAPTAADDGDNPFATIRPGAPWQPVLVSSKFVDVIGGTYATVRAAADPSTLHRFREILIQCGAIDGSIFPPPPPKPAPSAAQAAAQGWTPAKLKAAQSAVAAENANAVSPERQKFLLRLLHICSQMYSKCMEHAKALFLQKLKAGNGTAAAAAAAAVTPAQVLATLPAQLGDELLHICRLYQRLVYTHGLKTLVALGETSADRTRFLTELATLAVSLPLTDSATATSEALDIVLDTWLHVIAQFDEFAVARTTPAKLADRIGAELSALTGQVFADYLKRRLAVARDDALRYQQQTAAAAGGSSAGGSGGAASKEDDGDDGGSEDGHDGSGLDDQIQTVATIARMNAAQSLDELGKAIRQRTAALRAYAAAKAAKQATDIPVMVIHEQMYRLIQLMGHVLADPHRGESPTPPRALLRLSAAISTRGVAEKVPESQWPADPLVAAAGAVFEYVGYENEQISAGTAQPHDSQHVSLLVAQTAVWFLEHWLATYLMPDTSHGAPLPPRLRAAWGSPAESGNPQSLKLLESVLQKVALNLLKWPGEWRLADKTCDLLKTLVVAVRKVRPLLATTTWWKELVKAYLVAAADNKSALMRLRQSALTTLVQSMCYACAEAPYEKEEQRKPAFAQIVGPISARLQALLGHGQFGKVCFDPPWVDHLTVTLDMLRGVSKLTGKHAYHLAFAFLSDFFPALVKLLAVYHDHSQIVTGILTLFCDMAETEMQYLDGAQAAAFMRAVVAIVEQFSKLSSARMGRVLTAARAELAEEHQLDDVATLLRLLGHVLSKEATDNPFATANPFANPHAPQINAAALASDATLSALCMLLPHILKLFAYPTIAGAYFELLESLLATNPDKLAAVAPQQRAALLESIRSAVTNHNVTFAVQRSALKALTALASYHVSTLPAVQQARYKQKLADWQQRVERDAKLRDTAGGSGGGGAPVARKVVSLKSRAPRNNALTNSVLSANDSSTGSGSGSAGSGGMTAPASPGGSGGGGGGSSPMRGSGGRTSPAPKRPEYVPKKESPFGAELDVFQRVCLSLVLFERVDSELLDYLADALFPLIVAAQATYQGLAQSLIASQIAKHTDAALKAAAAAVGGSAPPPQAVEAAKRQAAEITARLGAGFAALVKDGGLSLEESARNRHVFRTNLRTFVHTVRGFIQAK